MIETTQSFVFLFDGLQKVLKVYKRDSDYWNNNFYDLSAGATRINFITQDFEWNNYFNPAVYEELAQIGSDFKLVKHDGTSDELVIVMKLIKTDNFIVPLLMGGKLSQGDFFNIGKQFADLKRGFRKHMVSTDYAELLKMRCDDLVTWMKITPVFTDKEIDQLYKKLTQYIFKNKSRLNDMQMHSIIDAHGENILYQDQKVGSIDIFLPMERWRTGAGELDLFRLGTDIYVLSGSESYAQYIHGVESVVALDKIDEDFYLLYMTALMCCAEENLAQTNPARKSVSERYVSAARTQLAGFP